MNNFLDRHRNYLKYLLVLSFITFVILFAATVAHGGWYNSNWQYRKKLTIQSSQVVGGPHSNFPMLISRTAQIYEMMREMMGMTFFLPPRMEPRKSLTK